MSFYKEKDATCVFYYIRTPPCQFSLSDEFVLPRKWWMGGRGVLHPIWDFHIWWYLLDRKHTCHFCMSSGCVLVENSGVSLFRNVTGWSFP